jgi:DNA-binding transcriptional ArsR family regulator
MSVLKAAGLMSDRRDAQLARCRLADLQPEVHDRLAAALAAGAALEKGDPERNAA